VLSRLRQRCDPTSSTAASRGAEKEFVGDVGLHINHAVLTGVVVAGPERARSRAGDPITVVLGCFAAPDGEVEIPDALADPHRRHLCAGRRLLVSGTLTGAGGLWARSIDTGHPRSEKEAPGDPR
jgi:hypothetical protein